MKSRKNVLPLSKHIVTFIFVILFGGINVCIAQEEGGAIDMIVENDVGIETRAGYEVFANVYRPNKEGEFPVIMSMGPYGKDDLPAEYSGVFGDGQVFVSEHAAFETFDPEYWVQNDYVVVAVDSPGSHQSGGNLDVFGPIEANAYYDAVEWAGSQPWSNGNVGLGGCSYFAMSQWYVAALSPPHLKAIMPQEGLTDFYRDVMRHGGIPGVFINPWMEYRVMRVKRPDAVLASDMRVGFEEHLLYDDYWESVNPALENITVPAYVMTSWADHGLHTRGTLIGFEEISSENKWLEIHGRKKWEYLYSRESLERQRKFFDYFLKNADNGFETTPRVRYERRNAFYDGHDFFADDWPLKKVDLQRYHLLSDSTLDTKASDAASSARYTANDENDQIAFRYVFKEPTEITGGAKLKLWVEAEGSDDMDIFVGLSKLDQAGNEVLMAGYNDVEDGHLASGWLRASHRETDPEKSTEIRPFLKHERLQKLSSGEIVPVEIEILPSSTYFGAGESLVLRIAGTELKGAGDAEHEDLLNQGHHVVHLGGEYDSHLLVPIVQQ